MWLPLSTQCPQTGPELPSLEENPDPFSSLLPRRKHLGQEQGFSFAYALGACSVAPSGRGPTSQPVKQKTSTVSLPKVPQGLDKPQFCFPSLNLPWDKPLPQSQSGFETHICCSLRDPSQPWGLTHLLWRSGTQRSHAAQAALRHRPDPSFVSPAGSFFELPWLATQTKDGLACCPPVSVSL